ncbi:hypothetical protein M0811_00730 [Anaeramoeba ignava]|uniref:TH1 domain-containing protein n=1 Tax=Anaeramoeba ignava TaxID=1746090 RepID=A0A9Q0LJL0_ANAIG|nr:hypothetical protein M0811_00730 [Anaeramoeba ignava]
MKAFFDKKERRRSSDLKEFKGDSLGLENKKAIKKYLSKSNNSKILFSGKVQKMNKRNKIQERVLMVTDEFVYNLDPGSYKSKREISINKINSIAVSNLPDNFFVIKVNDEYDYLFISPNKTEIISRIIGAYQKLTGNPLNLLFSDQIEYDCRGKDVKELVFSKTEDGIKTQIFQKKKK